VPDKKTIMLL